MRNPKYRFSVCTHLQVGLSVNTNKKTIATFVTTVSRLGGEDKTFRLSFSKKQSLKIRYLAFGKEPNFNNYCL